MTHLLKRAAFVVYSATILAFALPFVIVIHAYRFAVHIEDKWTLWLAAWAERNDI